MVVKVRNGIREQFCRKRDPGQLWNGYCDGGGRNNISWSGLNLYLGFLAVEMHPYLPQPKMKEFCESKGWFPSSAMHC